MTLSCSKKSICIIKRNNYLTILVPLEQKADWIIIKEIYENKDFCSVARPSEDLRF